MSTLERICRVCEKGTDVAQLDKCGVCSKYFCSDCAHRAYGGRKFCSPQCARTYYFLGEPDDDTLTGRED